MPINQEADSTGVLAESSDAARHQIADYDEVAYTDPKTLDSNRSVEHHGMMMVPKNNPIRERAKGIARTPAPTTKSIRQLLAVSTRH